MQADILIKGGHLIDSAEGLDCIGDIALKDKKILAVDTSIEAKAGIIIDAENCIVSPGLIDNHLHMFADATDAGIDPNIALLPNGITTAVEGGSPGVSNYELYRREVINRSRVRIKSYLSASSTGMITRKYPENFNPEFFERERIKELFCKYPDELLGLKIRTSKDIVGEGNARPLREVIKLAEEIGCKVTVHITDPSIDTEDIASMLRPGDVFCHVFQGKGNTIIREDGKVKKKVREAQQRGVIMDACNGKFNFSISVAQAAIADGFFPDIISTDYNTMVMYRHPVLSLPYLMSKYLALGMTLNDIMKACTATPAEVIGLKGIVGTLVPQADADIVILKVIEQESCFYDCHNGLLKGKQLLVPQMTLKGGNIVFRQVSFNKEFR
ncbi:MAG: metallo-dependent hydrolase [Spirochaetales bacterium]|nr:metallo-dependent hydrolase [Spirochaetales bacterium]